MAHNCIVVNLDRCTGCYSCEITCKMENDIALGEHWNKMLQRGPFGDYPNMTRYLLPTMCQQCADAPCVHVCPTGASYRDGNNVVLIDREKCIGCKYCMMACPYGVRDWNKASKTVEKCTLCGHLTANGELPACVKSCSAGAVSTATGRSELRRVQGAGEVRCGGHSRVAERGQQPLHEVHHDQHARRVDGRG